MRRVDQPIAALNDLRDTPTYSGLALAVRSLHAHQISALGKASFQLTASPDQALAFLELHSHLHFKVAAEHCQAHRPDVRFEISHGEKGSGSP